MSRAYYLKLWGAVIVIGGAGWLGMHLLRGWF